MMEQIQRHRLDNSAPKLTLRNGYWFYYNDGERRIAVHGCGYSGKETVYINDEQVLQQRNLLSIRSKHSFDYEGDNYEVSFDVESILRGSLTCTITKNGQHLTTETQAYLPKKGGAKRFIKELLQWMAYGFAFGFTVAIIFKLFLDN